MVHDCAPLKVMGSVEPNVATAVPAIVSPPVPKLRPGVAVPANISVPSSMLRLAAVCAPLTVMVAEPVASVPAENTTSLPAV